MQFFAVPPAIALLFALSIGGCAPGDARPPTAEPTARTSSIACVDAPPGSRCTMAMGDGDSSVAMSCTKHLDGAVACDAQ